MLQNISYCPTLLSRIAEIKAFGQLPSLTKDRMLPLFVARPWPNAKHAEATWEKIGEALGNRRFGLDIDRFQQFGRSGKPATMTFQSLSDSGGGFLGYYNAVASFQYAIPVLRILGGVALELDLQQYNIDRLDRGVIVRIELGNCQNPFSLADNVLKRFKDLTFIIDTGWSRDILSREVWASKLVEYIARRKPEIEMVVSGSSFPNSFVDFGKRRATRVDERVLFGNLTRAHNPAILVYGDWGSTRPPAAPVPMKNVPRIDLPTRSEWISFRRDPNLSNEEGYREIAERVIDDPSWPDKLNIWGTYTIDWTAKGEPGAIRGSATAAAARINIHLHRQAFFEGNDLLSDGDEPFTDD